MTGNDVRVIMHFVS